MLWNLLSTRPSKALALSSLMLMLILARSARAQEISLQAQAGELVAKGLKCQEAGRYDEAVDFYNAAYNLLPHPELLFNLGQAYRLRGDRMVAVDYYRKYIALQPDGRASKEAREWIQKIERAMRQEAAEEERRREAQRISEAEQRAATAQRMEKNRATEPEQGAEERSSAQAPSPAPEAMPRAEAGKKAPSPSGSKAAGVGTGVAAVFSLLTASALVSADHDGAAAGMFVAGGGLAITSLLLLLIDSRPATTTPTKTARGITPAFSESSASLIWTGRF